MRYIHHHLSVPPVASLSLSVIVVVFGDIDFFISFLDQPTVHITACYAYVGVKWVHITASYAYVGVKCVHITASYAYVGMNSVHITASYAYVGMKSFRIESDESIVVVSSTSPLLALLVHLGNQKSNTVIAKAARQRPSR